MDVPGAHAAHFSALVLALSVAAPSNVYAANTTILCQCRCTQDLQAQVFAVAMCTECNRDKCKETMPDCVLKDSAGGKRLKSRSTPPKYVVDPLGAFMDIVSPKRDDTRNTGSSGCTTDGAGELDFYARDDYLAKNGEQLFTIKCFQPGSYKDEIIIDLFIAIVVALFGYHIWTRWITRRARGSGPALS